MSKSKSWIVKLDDRGSECELTHNGQPATLRSILKKATDTKGVTETQERFSSNGPETSDDEGSELFSQSTYGDDPSRLSPASSSEGDDLLFVTPTQKSQSPSEESGASISSLPHPSTSSLNRNIFPKKEVDLQEKKNVRWNDGKLEEYRDFYQRINIDENYEVFEILNSMQTSYFAGDMESFKKQFTEQFLDIFEERNVIDITNQLKRIKRDGLSDEALEYFRNSLKESYNVIVASLVNYWLNIINYVNFEELRNPAESLFNFVKESDLAYTHCVIYSIACKGRLSEIVSSLKNLEFKEFKGESKEIRELKQGYLESVVKSKDERFPANQVLISYVKAIGNIQDALLRSSDRSIELAEFPSEVSDGEEDSFLQKYEDSFLQKYFDASNVAYIHSVAMGSSKEPDILNKFLQSLNDVALSDEGVDEILTKYWSVLMNKIELQVQRTSVIDKMILLIQSRVMREELGRRSNKEEEIRFKDEPKKFDQQQGLGDSVAVEVKKSPELSPQESKRFSPQKVTPNKVRVIKEGIKLKDDFFEGFSPEYESDKEFYSGFKLGRSDMQERYATVLFMFPDEVDKSAFPKDYPVVHQIPLIKDEDSEVRSELYALVYLEMTSKEAKIGRYVYKKSDEEVSDTESSYRLRLEKASDSEAAEVQTLLDDIRVICGTRERLSSSKMAPQELFPKTSPSTSPQEPGAKQVSSGGKQTSTPD